jgi:hypothetical protein
MRLHDNDNFLDVRRVWHNGRVVRDDNMVTTWNSWQTSEHIAYDNWQTSLHNKLWALNRDLDLLQVGLLNVDGYYDPLLGLFDKGAIEGFIKQDCKDIIVSAPTAHELLTKMEVKWLCWLIVYYRALFLYFSIFPHWWAQWVNICTWTIFFIMFRTTLVHTRR